jgi:hypothetical protein
MIPEVAVPPLLIKVTEYLALKPANKLVGPVFEILTKGGVGLLTEQDAQFGVDGLVLPDGFWAVTALLTLI